MMELKQSKRKKKVVVEIEKTEFSDDEGDPDNMDVYAIQLAKDIYQLI